jgi:pentatricopeptide repeat domain-containing protein 1
MNALIASCGRGGRPDLALAVFNDMSSKFGVAPDQRSYRSAAIACNQAQHENMLLQKRSQTMHGKGKKQSDAGEIQWWECALALLRRMKESGLSPDIQTFSSIISACEAAGQWQRALGVLQTMMDEHDDDGGESALNLYCFNAAISACEKGGAWVEALELYERMLDRGGTLEPNFVTLNSLVVALDKAGQKELAQSKYEEGTKMKIVNPWRQTKDQRGESIYAMVSTPRG